MIHGSMDAEFNRKLDELDATTEMIAEQRAERDRAEREHALWEQAYISALSGTAHITGDTLVRQSMDRARRIANVALVEMRSRRR